MQLRIAVIKGDGIGPEIVPQAVNVLTAIGEKYGHTFEFQEAVMGGAAIDDFGVPLPQETIDVCLKSDSVLLGSVGGPKWESMSIRPEQGLLQLRKIMGLYANPRPAKLFTALKSACPLRTDIADKGIDMIIVRELTGGIYFGERGRDSDSAFDTEKYAVSEIKRISKVAFDMAMTRNKRVTSVDKANVLESSRLWREVVIDTAKDYPGVELEHMYVDNAAMQLIKEPSQFDVILTTNMFGDILSDEAAMITGSIGMLPSASLGDSKCGLYEPIHGSAPDIAGQDIANPIATILSAAMMLKHSFGLDTESKAIENAVNKVLQSGVRTIDIKDENTTELAGTKKMGERIIANL